MDETALDAGFWHRLLGLLAVPGRATISAAQSLALTFPTSVQLSRDAARRLLNLAKLAMTASENWLIGAKPSGIVIPEVGLPELPNLHGGDPGIINASLLIPSGSPLGQHTPMQFSVNELPSVDEVIENMMSWLDANQGRYNDFENYIQDAIRNWRTGRRDFVVPHYLARRKSA